MLRPVTIGAVAILLSLAACGSDDKTVVVNPQQPAQPNTTVVNPPPPAAQGNTVVVPQSGSSTKICPNNQTVC